MIMPSRQAQLCSDGSETFRTFVTIEPARPTSKKIRWRLPSFKVFYHRNWKLGFSEKNMRHCMRKKRINMGSVSPYLRAGLPSFQKANFVSNPMRLLHSTNLHHSLRISIMLFLYALVFFLFNTFVVAAPSGPPPGLGESRSLVHWNIPENAHGVWQRKPGSQASGIVLNEIRILPLSHRGHWWDNLMTI